MRARVPAGQIVVGVLEQGSDLRERGLRSHERNHGRLRLEPIAEPLKEDVDELTIRHGVTEFAELVRHRLNALTVDTQRGVPLRDVADRRVEIVDPAVGVVLKELAQGRPEGGSGGGLSEDKIEDLRGHTSVCPLDDGEVVCGPSRIVGARGGVGGDVVSKIAAPEVDLEQMAPMVVVVLG